MSIVESMVTNINGFEKVYSNSYNHDAKALVLYTDGAGHLFSNSHVSIPVDHRLLTELFFAGVIIYTDNRTAVKPVELNFADYHYFAVGDKIYFGYDVENDCWAEPNYGGNPT